MARHKEKMLDPEWQAARRKDRHQLQGITIRVTAQTKATWLARAQQRGLTLSEWIIAACEHIADHEKPHEEEEKGAE